MTERNGQPPQWATEDVNMCRSKLFMGDDHWGLVTQTCDLIVGHRGDHMAELRACIPTARLCWPVEET